MNTTTANGLGIDHAAAARATGTLLFPGLGTTTADFATTLGVVGTQTGICHLALVCLVHQIDIDLGCEDLFGQVDAVCFFAF